MRRVRLAFAAGALVTAGALLAVWFARAPEPEQAAPALPSPSGVPPEPAPAPRVTPPAAPAASPTLAAPPAAAPDSARAEPPTREDAELVALEERAMRRVDVAAMLERAGIDRRELERRPDADDVVRHLAADELLTLLFMRQLLGQQMYQPSYPREEALSLARAAAQEVLAGLTPAERRRQLEAELARPPAPPPEPSYWPKR